MPAKESLLEVLRRQKAQAEADGTEDWEKVRDEWLNGLRQLRSKLQGWLRPAVEEGLLSVDECEFEATEHHLGTYGAPGLRITAPGERRVDVRPRARIIIGGHGRADLLSGPNKAMLVRAESGEWGIGLRNGGRLQTQELTEETFLELVSELLQ